MMILHVEHLAKHFDKKEVLKDITFDFKQGNIYGLLEGMEPGKRLFLTALMKI